MRLLAPTLVATCAIALAACGSDEAREFAGYVEGHQVLIGAEESGRLASLAVEEGDGVTQGAALFALDSRVEASAEAAARARLAEAEAALDQSSKSFERARQLLAQGVTPQSRLDEARAAFERDRAAVAATRAAHDEARTRLDRRSVAAPVAGLVQVVYFRPGEVVNAGQPVVAVLPPENLRVRFYVPEPGRAGIGIGDRVAVSCDGCPDGLTATVSFISSVAEFTPPVIFSREARRKLVYLVEARPQGAALGLTAGQPVTVVLGTGARVAGP